MWCRFFSKHYFINRLICRVGYFWSTAFRAISSITVLELLPVLVAAHISRRSYFSWTWILLPQSLVLNSCRHTPPVNRSFGSGFSVIVRHQQPLFVLRLACTVYRATWHWGWLFRPIDEYGLSSVCYGRYSAFLSRPLTDSSSYYIWSCRNGF